LAQYATAILTFSNDLLEKVLGSAVKLETAFSTHGEWVMQALLTVHGLYGQDQLEVLLARLGADRRIELGDGRSLNGELALTAVDALSKGQYR